MRIPRRVSHGRPSETSCLSAADDAAFLFRPAAVDELREARDWYDAQPAGLGAELGPPPIMLRKLVAVDAAEALDDLRVPPGNRLEKLKRDRAGQHSVRINDQWRICFRWTGTDAADVEIVNYH